MKCGMICLPCGLHSVSDTPQNKRKCGDAIKEWSLAVPNGKPTSRGANTIRSVTPSLTGSASHSSAPSVLTGNVKIISHQTSELHKVKVEPVPLIHLHDNSGLSNNDEMGGKA